ncbi:30S ribosomal protein S17e [Sulfuracidifex tepidarius]|uniref:30S ribosomal protein S17e n=1 Tax=Sulfuracidifex tepidarius TaxID=1294262 RepID=UPI0011F24FBE|nr:30S ribosomal protein S17e [Sulfuracidifex tepidarius]
MGTVYTKDIKHMAELIYEKYTEDVTSDYQKNKELVKKVVTVESKVVRNRLAGYLTRYYSKAKNKAAAQESIEEEETESYA